MRYRSDFATCVKALIAAFISFRIGSNLTLEGPREKTKARSSALAVRSLVNLRQMQTLDAGACDQ